MDRATPYHRPHSTQVAGYAFIIGGDDRYVGNLFIGGDTAAAYNHPLPKGAAPAGAGTAVYNGFPASFAEYRARVEAEGSGDHERFLGVKQPVYARRNVYAAGAAPFTGETDPLVLGPATATLVTEADAVYLVTDLPAGFDEARLPVVTGRDLERARFADADFEERDGTPAVMATDLLGTPKQTAPAGPITTLKAGPTRVRVW
jgi:hypothetical protein